jgi:hypothetical protein
MIEAIIFFLKECWAQGRNRFIAVAGMAVLFITVALASVSISWVPEDVMRALAFLPGTLVLATIALMLYYIARFVFVGSAILAKRVYAKVDDRPGAEIST